MSHVSPAIHAFIQNHLGSHFEVCPLAGDASFRSYSRVHYQQGTLILMNAPPSKEDSTPFINIAKFLKTNAVNSPNIIAQDLTQGYVLLEDFGDTTFLKALETTLPEILYEKAINELILLQKTPNDNSCIAHHRPYDRQLLRQELALFTDWYIEGIVKKPIQEQDRILFDQLFHRMIDQLLQQPVTLVHRDYHSRNLMWHNMQVGVLDFQDAVMGPMTYDLASLLRDCYVRWEKPFRDNMMQMWFKGAVEQLHYSLSYETFYEHFTLMGVQRNLKAVGIFGRLSLRDGKHGYLHDIPRTLTYVKEALQGWTDWEKLYQLIAFYTENEKHVTI